MALVDRSGITLTRGPVTVDLDDIQATVLRYRPEPYYGTHVMLHVDEPCAGRDFLRRLAPQVASAADWWQGGAAWISIAISFSGVRGAWGAGSVVGQLPRCVHGGDGWSR